jgi:hypothetical protein
LLKKGRRRGSGESPLAYQWVGHSRPRADTDHHRADRIYVMIGGELPARFLEHLGVRVDVKFGTV